MKIMQEVVAHPRTAREAFRAAAVGGTVPGFPTAGD